MQKVDYIVVGLGIAGICFVEQCLQLGKKVCVFNGGGVTSTKVSGGVFNPVILKRFTLGWDATEQLKYAYPFYSSIEKRLDVNLVSETPIYRLFNSVEEQNNWSIASDKSSLKPYLITPIHATDTASLNAPFGYGEVAQTKQIQTQELIKTYQSYLNSHGLLEDKPLVYENLKLTANNVSYLDYNAEAIVFCEGFAAKRNPYFTSDFIIGNKGDYIIIKAPNLNLTKIVKAPYFIIPQGNSHYKVGATFSHEDKTETIDPKAREHLVEKLKSILKCDFEVVDQVAGIRPTTIDRRPLLGAMPAHSNVYFFNGLGTRGISSAPLLSKKLIDHIVDQKPLDKEIRIQRMLTRKS